MLITQYPVPESVHFGTYFDLGPSSSALAPWVRLDIYMKGKFITLVFNQIMITPRQYPIYVQLHVAEL